MSRTLQCLLHWPLSKCSLVLQINFGLISACIKAILLLLEYADTSSYSFKNFHFIFTKQDEKKENDIQIWFGKGVFGLVNAECLPDQMAVEKGYGVHYISEKVIHYIYNFI